MSKNLCIAFVLLFCINSTAAYERYSFELDIPNSYKTEEYKPDLDKWVNSLILGVGYESDKITTVIFLRTDISITVNGKAIDNAVYQNKDEPNQFYISKPKLNVVDFNSEQIGTMGVAGISAHPTPSGRMIVVLAPQRNTNILGVHLSFTSKTQVRKPVFKKRSVEYEW